MAWTRTKVLAGTLSMGMVGIAAWAEPPATRNAGTPPCVKGCFFQSETPIAFAPQVTSAEPPLAKPAACLVPSLELPVVAPVPAPPPVKVDLVPLLPRVEVPAIVPVTVMIPDVTPAPPKPVDPPARVTPQTPADPTVPFHKVTIHFGTKPMMCEVSSNEATLKFDCDGLDVRMPGDAGANTSPLKAMGHVRFTAPGCKGSCDELIVHTTTGEVLLHGNVKLRCQQGQIETEVTGTSVKFKLGSAILLPSTR